MNQIVVYMIDDQPVKQKWFNKIMERANSRIGDAQRQLVAGFGENAEVAAQLSRDPNELWQAAKHDHAIYIVDLNVPGTNGFEDLVRSANDQTSRTASELVDKQPWSVQEQRGKFPGIVHLIAYLTVKKRPFILASTEQPVQELMLAFPPTTHPAYPFPAAEEVAEAETAAYSMRVDVWAKAILSLLDPLDLIRTSTVEWFTKRSPVTHQTDQVNSWTAHQECVTRVFPFLQNAIWGDATQRHALHEALKTLVGHHANWMGAIGDRPLSLVGAYLVFLVAIQQHAPDHVGDYIVDDWTKFFVSKDDQVCYAKNAMPFIALQPQEAAKRTVQSLYELLSALIVRGDYFGLKGFQSPAKDSPRFGIHLSWDPSDVEDLASSVCRAVNDMVDHSKPLAGEKAAGKLLRFVLASQAASDGFGPRGGIWLESNSDNPADWWLYFGQGGVK